VRLYYSFGEFLKERFPYPVYKLPVDGGFTCPTRDGRKGKEGCSYCYPQSFSPTSRKKSIQEQIRQKKALVKNKKQEAKFLVYFQPYTNTYAPLQVLKKLYEEALGEKDVIGLCIGTRPDCISDEILKLIQSYTQRYHIWLEYGLQSIHPQTLARINRGHTFEEFKDAVAKTNNRGIFICVHIILGLPGETQKEILETARAIAHLEIQGVKLHHLQVIKGTRLAKEFERGEFKTLTLAEYITLVSNVLEILPSDIVIQRLVGETLSQDLLIAPRWGRTKSEIISAIKRELQRRGSYQGCKFEGV
jgi:hypothetical protein